MADIDPAVTPNLDLTQCDREPIHQIGQVQNFGALIAVDGEGNVTHRSDNFARITGLAQMPPLGTQLADLIEHRAFETLSSSASRLGPHCRQEFAFGLRLVKGGQPLDCALHHSDGLLVLEFEPHRENAYHDHTARLGSLLAQLATASGMDELFTSAPRLLRDALGYDRVMLYRFRHDMSGEVVAEDRRNDLQAYLGLRYPKTDIPAQARDLFLRNRFRVIADVDAEPSCVERTVEASQGQAQEPLDISLSILRSSSPIHLEYLRNMGVAASMTVAITRSGKLWGLITCHHGAPMLPTLSQRLMAEIFGQSFSLMLDRQLIAQSDAMRERGRAMHNQLIARLASGTSLLHEIPALEQVLGSIIEHDGMSVWIDGQYRARGAAPSADQFKALLPALKSDNQQSVIASEALADIIPAARPFAGTVAGALILPISRSPHDYLALWRKPLDQVVRWGGDPVKPVSSANGRLQPRGSFDEWRETVRGKAEEWSEDAIIIAEGLRITLLEVVLRMTDEVARERKRAQEQQELLIAELNHRVRNILNLIRSLVSQSRNDADSVSSFAKIIGGRISALASAHDNITRQNWNPAPLSALFESEFEAYVSGKTDRFALNGKEVLITPEAYTVMALVVHELVTNSAKYGSLCDSKGGVEIETARLANGDLSIQWREFGGPPVTPPSSRGFGSTIIERSIPFELKGEADLRFKLTGVEADFTIPARYVVLDESGDRETMTEPTNNGEERLTAAQAQPDARPGDVLVIEDNMIIALETEDNLKRLGVRSIRVESGCNGALSAIAAQRPDFAIVDFNLGNESSMPVIRELAKLGVGFVLATGYSEMDASLEQLGAAGIVRKPYGSEDIERALDLYSPT